jgi:ribonuclease T2
MQVKDGKLSYEDKTTFYADQAPRGRTQSNVYASQEERSIEIEITWVAKSY